MQSKAWLENQALEKAACKQFEDQQTAAHGELAKYCDVLQNNAIAEENRMRRHTNCATRADNDRLAQHQQQLQKDERDWEQLMNNHEIEYALQNPVLSEDPKLAASMLSPFRVRKDHWKGMTPTERKAILDEQFRQTEEMKLKRQAELAREAGWARTALDVDNALREKQRMADDFRKQQADQRLQFLRAQAEEKRLRDIKLTDTYANKIAPEYFSQFGMSHR